MKTHIYMFTIASALAGALALSTPFLASAQTPPPSFRARLEQHIVDNRDYRNELRGATTTRALPADAPRMMREGSSTAAWAASSTTMRSPMRLGSSTPMRLGSTTREWQEGSSTRSRMMATSTDERREVRTEVRADAFASMQDRLVSQATQALDNLRQIRSRVAARIQTEQQGGHDTNTAGSLLTIADAKISAAQAAVTSLKAFIPPAAASASITASTTAIDLQRPREIGTSAIQAINDAQKALNAVVTAIAHSLGLEISADGRIQATTTATSTQR